LRGEIPSPEDKYPAKLETSEIPPPEYDPAEKVATRNAYGNALKRIYPAYPNIVVLDAEVSNSTRSKFFKEKYPERFFEMYIAEQNMVDAAIGLSSRLKKPFVSSFAAFLSRAYDQVRMGQFSSANITYCGSHAGVSIGEDGPSQMGLEDLAFFRTIFDGLVLYPCDPYQTERLVEETAGYIGIAYIRTTRGKTPVIYGPDDEFPIGGSKVLRSSPEDKAAVVAAGITLHEALEAADALEKEGVRIRVVDLYCIKPIDAATLRKAAAETGRIITVEDHSPQGGLGEAVMSAIADDPVPVRVLAVDKIPRSGAPEELLESEGIAVKDIIATVKEIV
jgi:transketolase